MKRRREEVSDAGHLNGRISLMTFNVWRGEDGQPAHWPQRKHVFTELLKHFEPDVLCIQEGHPTLQAAIREALPDHECVNADDAGDGCWASEGNIFWNATFLECLGSGAHDVGISATRRLQLVKLRFKSHGHGTFLVSTAHFPWVGNENEVSKGLNPRAEITRNVLTKLEVETRANSDTFSFGLPVFFMGDLNESYHPVRILREAGFQDCFAALGIPNSPTHPARPSSAREESLPDRAIDWLFAKGPASPILANVLKGCFYGGMLNASDHYPVMAVYQLGKARLMPSPEMLHEAPYSGAW